jgi:hypothetical protein
MPEFGGGGANSGDTSAHAAEEATTATEAMDAAADGTCASASEAEPTENE